MNRRVSASARQTEGPGPNSADSLSLLFRVSTSSKDIPCHVRPSDSILVIKHSLHAKHSQDVPPPSQQRMYFGGRILLDRSKVKDYKLKPGFVVQVIVVPPAAETSTVQVDTSSAPVRTASASSRKGRASSAAKHGKGKKAKSLKKHSEQSRTTTGHSSGGGDARNHLELVGGPVPGSLVASTSYAPVPQEPSSSGVCKTEAGEPPAPAVVTHSATNDSQQPRQGSSRAFRLFFPHRAQAVSSRGVRIEAEGAV